MNFTEKFNALLSITNTTPSALARAMYVDRTQISRLKTGARGKPTKPSVLREMAEYFANCCNSEYQLAALYHLTTDIRFQSFVPENERTEIIYQWLDSDEEATRAPVMEPLLKNQSIPIVEQRTEKELNTGETGLPQFTAYYGNAGKRQAVLELMEHLLELKKPCTVLILTDEDNQWLIEDVDFNNQLGEKIKIGVERGFRFQLILSPFRDLEYALNFFERWIAAYSQEVLRFFYYPRTRDNLYRRTLLVIPDQVAICSNSLHGQQESRATIVTRDMATVNTLMEEYWDILGKCRPMMKVHTLQVMEDLLDALLRMEKRKEETIYLSAALSSVTLPEELVKRVAKCGIPGAKQVGENWRQRSTLWKKNCKKYVQTEIISLASIKDIFNGDVEIPLSRMLPGEKLYYTPNEYCIHLENIIQILNKNPNYRLIILDILELQDVVVYAKGVDEVLFFKGEDSLTVCEIAEKLTASALCDHLRYIVDSKMRFDSRKSTIERMEHMIGDIRSKIGESNPIMEKKCI